MQSLNKIHINGSTKISLSDRFSILQSAAPAAFKAGAAPAKIAGRRNSRSRSRSRAINYTGAAQPQVQPAVNAKTSIRNRNLLAQLDQKQKMRAALKIKRKSLRTNLPRANAPQRGRPAGILRRNTTIAQARRGAPAAARLGRLQQNATMRADLQRQGTVVDRRRRSVSGNRGGALAGRLGVNAANEQQPRRRLNRGNLTNAQRSNSRSRSLARSNSQTRLGGAAAAPRSQSRGRQASVQRRGREPSVEQRARSASRGRRPVGAPAQSARIPNPRTTALPKRGRSASQGRQAQQVAANRQRGGARGARVAATPISARLGVNRNRVAAAGGGQQRATPGVARGRVQKRAPVVVRGKRPVNGQPRVDRSSTRPGQRQPATAARGRSQSRGRKPQVVNKRNNNNSQGKPNNANISKANRSSGGQRAAAAVVRGRSRVRSRGGPQSAGGKSTAQPTKSREQLDKELDQYMVNTKPYGDLDTLMM